MNILLIGEYFSSNLGDPLLCSTVKKIIHNHFPDAQITPFDLSGRINFTELYPLEFSFFEKCFLKLSNELTKLFSLSKLYQKYKKSELRYLRTLFHLKSLLKENDFELAIFAGGSLFMDYFIPLIFIITKILKRNKTKIIFHACGTGQMDKHDKKLLKYFLNDENVISISARDSYDFINNLLKNKSKLIETYDTALNSPSFFKADSSKSFDLGIGIMGNGNFLFQKELVNLFLNSTFNWKLFTNGAEYDYNAAKKILSELGINATEHHKYLLPRPTTPEQLINDINSFNKIISFRMHSLIVACSYGIPLIGINWDKKVVEFMTKMQLSKFCYNPDKNFSMTGIDFPDSKVIKANAKNQGNISETHLIQSIKNIGAIK